MADLGAAQGPLHKYHLVYPNKVYLIIYLGVLLLTFFLTLVFLKMQALVGLGLKHS